MDTHKILVVEDEISLQKAIQNKLITNGFEAFTARKVDEAVEILGSENKIEAIWLDHYLLGDKDGFDFVVKLKSSEKWKNIPIFVISNTASPEKIDAYINLGVEKYYTKSDYRLDQIIDEIKTHLEK